MARPRPSPPWRRVMVESAWRKRSKMKGRNSAATPSPVSVTVICARPSARCSRTSTRPPEAVNLMAFASRFQTTCCRRLASPVTCRAAGSRITASWMPLVSAFSRTESVAALITVDRSTGPRLRRRLPVITREASRMSSMSWAWVWALRSITRPRGHRGSSVLPRRRMCDQPRIAFSGVRNSRDGGEELVFHPVGGLGSARAMCSRASDCRRSSAPAAGAGAAGALDRVGRDPCVEIHEARLPIDGRCGHEQHGQHADRVAAPGSRVCCGSRGRPPCGPPRDRARRSDRLGVLHHHPPRSA